MRERIARAMKTLTRSERHAAHVLLADYPMLGLESISRLAERAGASVATIQRFALKLGFASYPEFRAQLRAELAEAHAGPLTMTRWYEAPEAGGATSGDVLRGGLVQAVETTLADVEPAELAAVIERVSNLKRRVWLLGGAFTRPLAAHLHFHLRKLRAGIVLLEQDMPRRCDALLDVRRDDTLIVFDVRRYQPDTALTARFAADRGARIVLVTDQWMSDISRFADHVFRCRIDASTPWDTLIGPLALVETIAAAADAALWPDARPRLEHLDELGEAAFVSDAVRRDEG